MQLILKQVDSNKKRGSILILVLALVVMMSVIITKFISVTVSELKRKSLQQMNSDLRTEAYSYLDLSLAVIINQFISIRISG